MIRHAFTPSNFSLPVGGYKNQNLPVQVMSIIAENTASGTLSLLPNGNSISTIIDSTVAELWLPQNVCDLFAQTFGLEHNAPSGLYLVNDTTHQRLEQLNPSITITLGDPGSSSTTTNIILPYSAFNLQAGLPIFGSHTNYFPIRVAANESQQVLGRVVLQEAYVVVDWERQNFTIAQALHQNKVRHIVSILSPTLQAASSALSTGEIAGIVVGGCAALTTLIALIIFLTVRARRKREQATHSQD